MCFFFHFTGSLGCVIPASVLLIILQVDFNVWGTDTTFIGGVCSGGYTEKFYYFERPSKKLSFLMILTG